MSQIASASPAPSPISTPPPAGMWPDARVEALTRAWREGLSANQIAARLGGGLTRCAVIGKLHRLGLTGGRKPSAPRIALAPSPPPKALLRPEPIVPKTLWPKTLWPKTLWPESVQETPQLSSANGSPPDPPGPKYLRDMSHRECRFGLGDPGIGNGALQLFCAAPTTGHAYCAHHRAIAILPPQSLREQNMIKAEFEALLKAGGASGQGGRGDGRRAP